MSRALSHFIDLAICGQHDNPKESQGAALLLAVCVIDSLCLLDPLARDGLRNFIDLATHSRGSARDLVFGGGHETN